MCLIFGGVGTFVKSKTIDKTAKPAVIRKIDLMPKLEAITGPRAIARAKLIAINPPIIAIAFARDSSSTKSAIIAVTTEPIAEMFDLSDSLDIMEEIDE